MCMRRSVFALLSSTLILLYSVTFVIAVVAAAVYLNGRRRGDATDNKQFPIASSWQIKLTRS